MTARRAIRRTSAALIGLGLLSVAGCQTSQARETAGVDGAPPAATGVQRVAAYVCTDGRRITARYDGADAALSMGGMNYALTTAASASGARYTGDGLQWWTRGDEATIANLAPGEDLATSDQTTCRVEAG